MRAPCPRVHVFFRASIDETPQMLANTRVPALRDSRLIESVLTCSFSGPGISRLKNLKIERLNAIQMHIEKIFSKN